MRRHFGFTLIEVMIVTAVTVILLGAVFSVNFRITDMWRSERVRQALQQNFRFAADMMTTNLRQATAISLPVSNTLGDTLQFDYVATLVSRWSCSTRGVTRGIRSPAPAPLFLLQRTFRVLRRSTSSIAVHRWLRFSLHNMSWVGVYAR
jgi:prepilin-type N-terminal cleavage/methylation domain-containing protein